MTGPAVIEASAVPEPTGDKPNVALHADSLLEGFHSAAKENRRKAAWYFIKSSGAAKVVLAHAGEDPIELTDGASDQTKIASFLSENTLPLFGALNGDTFDRYMEA